MLKHIKQLSLALLGTLLLISFNSVADEQRGTAEQAQALVAKAIAYFDANDAETAFAAFNRRDGEFVDRDLYVFVYGPDRTIISHGADVGLIGTPVDTLIDINGKPFATAIQDEATEDGVWVNYTWYNPISRELHAKSSWVVRHEGYVFGAGIYLDDAE